MATGELQMAGGCGQDTQLAGSSIWLAICSVAAMVHVAAFEARLQTFGHPALPPQHVAAPGIHKGMCLCPAYTKELVSFATAETRQLRLPLLLMHVCPASLLLLRVVCCSAEAQNEEEQPQQEPAEETVADNGAITSLAQRSTAQHDKARSLVTSAQHSQPCT